jgi:transformation/transcription domain-associated protein
MHASAAGPTTPVEVETVARILLDKDVPTRKKFEITSELKDTAETQKDYTFYEKYLGVLFPVMSKLLLEEDKIVFVKENLEQVCRFCMNVDRIELM